MARSLLFLTADWSATGALMAPMVKKLARESKLELIVLDVDRRPELVRQYALRGLPVLILSDDDRVLGRWDGLQPEFEMRRELSASLSGSP